jgi:hypothetical protein
MATNYQWLLEDSVAKFSELMRQHRRLTAEAAKVEKAILKREKTLRWAAARLRQINCHSLNTAAQTWTYKSRKRYLEAVRTVLKTYPIRLTPVQVRDLLGTLGFNASQHRNVLADVHQSLRRLAIRGEVIQEDIVPHQPTYLWNTATVKHSPPSGDKSATARSLNGT